MSIAGCYRWSLLLPLVFPMICFPPRFIGPEFGPCYVFALVMVLSLVVGAFPYMLSVAIVSPLLRSSDERKVVLAVWFLPVVMSVLIAAVGYAPSVGTWVGGKPGLRTQIIEATPWVVFFLKFTLMIGYSYVVVVQVICWLCRWAGWVGSEKEVR